MVFIFLIRNANIKKCHYLVKISKPIDILEEEQAFMNTPVDEGVRDNLTAETGRE